MNYYLLLNRDQKRGPFPKEELLAAGMVPTSLVWHKGLADWNRAEELPELAALFSPVKSQPDLPVDEELLPPVPDDLPPAVPHPDSIPLVEWENLSPVGKPIYATIAFKAFVGVVVVGLFVFLGSRWLGIQTGESGSFLSRLKTSINPQSDLLFIGNRDSLTAMDPLTGQSKWSFQTAGPIYTTTADDGLVVVAADDKIYGLSTESGELKWQFDGVAQSSLLIANGKLFFVYPTDEEEGRNNRVHMLYAVDIVSGKLIWQLKMEPLYGIMGVQINFQNNTLVMANYLKLYAIDPEKGLILWQTALEGECYATPAVGSGMVFLHTLTHLTAYNIRSGQRMWSTNRLRNNVNMGYYTEISNDVVLGDQIFSCSLFSDNASKANLQAYDLQSGQQKWAFPLGKTVQENDFYYQIAHNGTDVFVCGRSGSMVKVSAKTGQPLWRNEYRVYISDPVAVDQLVYYWEDTILHAVDSETGQEKWFKKYKGHGVYFLYSEGKAYHSRITG